MLKDYLDKYYLELINKIRSLISKGVLVDYFNNLLLDNDNKIFILNADNSSIINYLYSELVLWQNQFLWDYNFYLEKLKKEIYIFLNEWINSINLIMNSWDLIEWTNIRLTNNENNPYSLLDAHPDHKKTWWWLSWWNKSKSDWLDIYKKTFDLLKKVDFWIYSELNYIITKVVPLWTSVWVHNSASYKESIGHLYLWYTIDSWMPEINNLEAVIHESSHNKLNLIKQFDPLLLNDYQEKYYSAIRPDARHIHWVFIWYHAFAPTMYIIMKAYKDWLLWESDYWFEKIVLYHIKTKFLQRVIKKYANLTDLWKEISQEIDYVIILMDRIIKELNPSKELLQKCKLLQAEHFNSVNKNYIGLEY